MGRFDCRLDRPPALLELENVLFLPELRCLYARDGVRIEQTKVTYVEPDAPAWFNDQKTLPIEQ